MVYLFLPLHLRLWRLDLSQRLARRRMFRACTLSGHKTWFEAVMANAINPSFPRVGIVAEVVKAGPLKSKKGS